MDSITEETPEKDSAMEKGQIDQAFKKLEDSNFADVMVVGGGISGIQASLDLADSGYRVYLVETSPAIGGKMAQLDKTYPTNDC
jgi:heterodisulfide reductase subunit A